MENKTRVEQWIFRLAVLTCMVGMVSCTKGPDPEQLVPSDAHWALHVWMPGVGWELLTSKEDSVLLSPTPTQSLSDNKSARWNVPLLEQLSKNPLQNGMDFSGALWVYGRGDAQVVAVVRLASRAKWEATLQASGYSWEQKNAPYGSIQDTTTPLFAVWSDHTLIASNQPVEDSMLHTRYTEQQDWKRQIAKKAGQPEAMITVSWLKKATGLNWLDSGRLFATLTPSRTSVRATLHVEEVHGEAKKWLNWITVPSEPVCIPIGQPILFFIGFALAPQAVDTLFAAAQRQFPDVFSFAGTSYDSVFRALVSGEIRYTRFGERARYHLAFGLKDTTACDRWLTFLYDQGILTSSGMHRYSLAKLYTIYREGTYLHWGNTGQIRQSETKPAYMAACVAYPAALDSSTWGLLPSISNPLLGRLWYTTVQKAERGSTSSVEIRVMY
jgi:hypothetical protein